MLFLSSTWMLLALCHILSYSMLNCSVILSLNKSELGITKLLFSLDFLFFWLLTFLFWFIINLSLAPIHLFSFIIISHSFAEEQTGPLNPNETCLTLSAGTWQKQLPLAYVQDRGLAASLKPMSVQQCLFAECENNTVVIWHIAM